MEDSSELNPAKYGKPDYQASETVIGETGRVMGIKNDT